MRLGALAALYGLVAGVVAALVLWLMGVVSRLVWAGPDKGWYIFLMVMTGGALIALLRHFRDGEGLADQIADLGDPGRDARQEAAIMAAMAIVAVGFGGAIGPEAGILAVVSELSALIGARLALNNADERLLAEAGAAGALGGLYGSPPAGAMVVQEHPEAPRWQLYLAALTGLFGFLSAASLFLPDHALRISLPAYDQVLDGREILWSVLPALLGAAGGLAFIVLLPALQAFLSRFGGVVAQTMLGTLIFALLAATWPILRFSGHHELEAMLDWAAGAGMAALLGLAFLKALALAICLASGWRGGAAFPLLFIGAAAGASALWIAPDLPVTPMLIAGMTAALTVGMGKPLAAMLIAALIIGLPAVGPLCVGAAVGWAAAQLVKTPQLH